MLTAAAGMVPVLVDSDSRNMAAQIDSRLPGVEFEFTGPHWRGIYDEKGRLSVVNSMSH